MNVELYPAASRLGKTETMVASLIFSKKKALGHTLILSEVGRTAQYRQSVPKGLLQNPDQGIFKS
jgi:hypothetical protein